jgi:hypothetical protein
MARPGDDTEAGMGSRGDSRASHADREQVIDRLKVAFVQGRLGKDEFDVRVGHVLASRTYADLAVLTADILTEPTGAQPLEPARQSDSVPAPRTIARVTAAGAGASMVVIGAELMKSGGNPAVGVVVVGLTGLLAAALIAGLLLFLSYVFKKSSRRSVTNHGTQPKLCGTVFSARHWPVKDPGPSALHRRGEAGTPGPERLRTRLTAHPGKRPESGQL